MADPTFCDRCGALAAEEWFDVSTFGDEGVRLVRGRTSCPTPGCVDVDGSNAVEPPAAPGELTPDDRRWLKAQRRLADEYARVARLLEVV